MQAIRKQKLHEHIQEEIKAHARRQLANGGAAALSLGGIAREMGLSTPALYRYFPGRNSLVDVLAEEAYQSFNQSLESALSALPIDECPARFHSLCLAYHAWALDHPGHYELLFGSSVPGYSPEPQVGGPADRGFQILLDELRQAENQGRITPGVVGRIAPGVVGRIAPGVVGRIAPGVVGRITPGVVGRIAPDTVGQVVPSMEDRTASVGFGLAADADLRQRLAEVHHPGQACSTQVLVLALGAWSFMHGLVSLQLHRRYELILGDSTDTFIGHAVDGLVQSLFSTAEI
jgi:AcrR family transcriptional regulator